MWKPFLTSQGTSFLHHLSIMFSCFPLHRSRSPFFEFMLILLENNDFGNPFTIQCAPNLPPKSVNWCKQSNNFDVLALEPSRRYNIQKCRVDWTFVLSICFVVMHSPILAVHCLQNIWFVLILVNALETLRNTRRIGPSNSNGRKNGAPNRQ